MDELEEMARESYDRVVGLELSEVAVDCCIQRRPHVGARRREESR
jgi:hypothetical protein